QMGQSGISPIPSFEVSIGIDGKAEVKGQVHQKLLAIQELANDFNFNNNFANHLTKLANAAREVSDQYKEFWNQYILQEKILKNPSSDSYKNYFFDIMHAAEEYNLSSVNQDEEGKEAALESLSRTMAEIQETVSDKHVLDYFNNMYPAVQDAVKQWKFKTTILPQFDLSLLEGKSQEDIFSMLTSSETHKEKEVFNSILEKAREYQLYVADSSTEVQKLLDLLVQWGILQGEISNSGSASFTIGDYGDNIDSIQSSLSTLRSALDSFNLGSMTEESVLDLMQQFPELAPYIDLTAQGFGRLSEGLNMLIAQQPASLLESLQALKASLHTEEERAEVDLLIDSLQRLSSYGDSGMEAYAAAIGTTWNDTANVIGSVTSQFENLAKVQDAVSGGLTMSAAAAAELAKMYPEILTNAVVAANGQVTLNEDVVRNILQGDQSILNAQIAKLEGDKAVLTAKKSFAEAQLNMLKQVGEGEGQIAMETAQYRLNTANQLLKALIDIGMEEAKAYAAVAANMAGNMDEYNRIVGEVAIDSSSNMNLSALSMATTIDVNSSHAQDSITALQKKAHEGAKSIKAMGKGETGGSLEKFQGGGASSLKKIEITKHPGKFHPTSVDIDFKEIDLDEFQSQLELDIQGYTDAISHIDSQIEILKGLQSTFQNTVSSPNGGIGGHNYGDKIKELEKEKEKINSSLNDAASKGSSSPQEKKEEYKELFDFFERRVKVLNTALSLLKTNLDNVTGSFGKNQLLDAQLSITEETFQNYSDALSMYTEKANEALSKIPGDIAKKVKDGAVDLTTFVGDGNKEVMDAIQEYEKWADKINNCKEELAKLKTAIRQLELEKFNNIMEDFSNQFDLREDGKGLISKQMDLLKEAGQFIGESFFTSQMEQSKKQLSLLEEKKTKLASQLASSLSSGRVEAGTDEWLAMVQSLSDVEGEILDCKKAIEAFDNELLQLHWDIFDQVQKQFSQLDSELSNLEGLFDGFKVTGIHGGWSKEGLAQIGLLAQQYELAQYQVEQYNNAIDKLHGDYLAGKYSATEYADKLAALSSAQWEAVNRSESILDAIVNLNEVRINEEINAIKKEVDAYKELINAQIESLKTAKELHDYQQTIADKTKSITDLERQIAAMENDDTAATIAKRKLLEEQLAQARKELENTQYNHSIQMQEEALNKELENYEGEKNAEIEALRLSLEERELLIAQSFEIIKMNADLVGQEIALIAMNHGIIVSDAIITPWQSGEGAIASYGEVLSSSTSAFIGQLFGVANEIYALQNQANQTADSLAFMFSQRADNLVHELTASYYSEANLNAMTKALHDSLVNTLEGGYNISGITNALGGIASAANHVALAANNAASALANMGAARTAAASGYSSPGLGSIGSFTPIPTPTRRQGDRVIEVMQQEEDGKWRKYAYASGTRNAKGGLRVVNERGKELVLPKLSSGNYAIGNAGDQILTKPQTDNLFAWSAFQPEDFLDLFASMPIDTIPLTQEIGNIPEVLSHVASPPSIHLDKMVHIDHVDSTNLKQVEMLIYKAQDKFIHQLYDGMKYRQL
ncbi:MAG: hypothetical protein HFI78_12430, partial [Lachnospiraceae bacterium]|nr:hypothetical protein [Lachnospiraceae bacterium]